MLDNRDSSPNNGVEVVSHAVHFSAFELTAFDPWVQRLVMDYVLDRDAALGPGPSELAEMYLGPKFRMSQFEAVSQ